jgi:hypothetical protein
MAKKRTPEECHLLAGDFERIASTHGDLRVIEGQSGFVTPTPKKFTKGKKLFGTVVGPSGNEIYYDVSCAMPRDGGKTCASFEIKRRGPGAKGLEATRHVGNVHGLKRQMARDAARAWGCPPPPTRGFEGARRQPKRRKRGK